MDKRRRRLYDVTCEMMMLATTVSHRRHVSTTHSVCDSREVTIRQMITNRASKDSVIAFSSSSLFCASSSAPWTWTPAPDTAAPDTFLPMAFPFWGDACCVDWRKSHDRLLRHHNCTVSTVAPCRTDHAHPHAHVCPPWTFTSTCSKAPVGFGASGHAGQSPAQRNNAKDARIVSHTSHDGTIQKRRVEHHQTSGVSMESALILEHVFGMRGHYHVVWWPSSLSCNRTIIRWPNIHATTACTHHPRNQAQTQASFSTHVKRDDHVISTQKNERAFSRI